MITDLERMRMNLDGIAFYLDRIGLKSLAGYAREAVEKLKEQEPVEPTEERQNECDSIYRCGSCGVCFFHKGQRYCAWCGKPVKWEVGGK